MALYGLQRFGRILVSKISLRPGGTIDATPAQLGIGTATQATPGLVKQGVAVANATDAATAITQLNAALASLRASGTIAP